MKRRLTMNAGTPTVEGNELTKAESLRLHCFKVIKAGNAQGEFAETIAQATYLYNWIVENQPKGGGETNG